MKKKNFLLLGLLSLTLLSFTHPSFKKILKMYPFVPSGVISLEGQQVSLAGFHISKHEVTNLEYREFLAALEREGREADLKIAQIDPSGWEIASFRETYHQHPAYENYPVVNISYEGASLYCKWLEGIYREKYGQKVQVRLPLKAEWIWAAQAGQHAPYPWGGYYLRDEKGKMLANYNPITSEQITFNQQTGQYEVVTGQIPAAVSAVMGPAPVESFIPNLFGLYNTSGNVAEMLQEKGLAIGGSWASPGYDIRVESISTYNGPSPQVGFRPVLVFETPR